MYSRQRTVFPLLSVKLILSYLPESAFFSLNYSFAFCVHILSLFPFAFLPLSSTFYLSPLVVKGWVGVSILSTPESKQNQSFPFTLLLIRRTH
jgi:hypothetical protein